MHLTIVQLKSSRWIREDKYWKNELQLHFFYELQFRKPGCGCRSDSTHGVHPENSLGYLFMALGMVCTHQHECFEATGNLEGILSPTEYLAEYNPAAGVLSRKKMKSRDPSILHVIICSDSHNLFW